MDMQSPPINHPEVARLRRQSAQRKYKRRLRKARLLWVVAGVLFLLLLGEMLVALCTSPRFWIRAVTVRNRETLQEREVLALMQLPAYSNYFRVSLAGLARNIEREPRVARAEVKRGAIGTLQVTVHERQAVCRLGTAAPPWYLDDGGILFQRPPGPALPVPVIAGAVLAPPAVVAGTPAPFPQRAAVLETLRALRAAPGGDALRIAALTLQPAGRPGDVTLVATLRQGARIRLGAPVFLHEKAICLQQTLAQAARAGHPLDDLALVNVDFVDERTKDTGVLGTYTPKPRSQETQSP